MADLQFGAGAPGTSWGLLSPEVEGTYRTIQYRNGSIALLACAFVFVALRMFTRIFVVHNTGPDDYLACIGLACAAVVVAAVIVGANAGVGKPLLQLTSNNLVEILKSTFWFVLVDIIGLVAVKLSILFLYRRMTPSRKSLLVLRVVGIIVILHGIAAFVGSIFQCTPVNAFWNPLLYSTHCFAILPFDVFNTAFSITSEIAIDLLPIPVIRQLHISKQKKACLFALLGVSVLGVAAAAVKLVALIQWMRSDNINQNFALVPFTSAAELCIFLITTSVPAIHPLLRKFNNRVLSRISYPSFSKLRSYRRFDKARSGHHSSCPESASARKLQSNSKEGFPFKTSMGSSIDSEHGECKCGFRLLSTTSTVSEPSWTFLGSQTETYVSKGSRIGDEESRPPSLFTHWEASRRFE